MCVYTNTQVFWGCSLFTLQNHTQQCSSIIPSRAQGDTMWYEDSDGIHTGRASHLLYLFDPKNVFFGGVGGGSHSAMFTAYS